MAGFAGRFLTCVAIACPQRARELTEKVRFSLAGLFCGTVALIRPVLAQTRPSQHSESCSHAEPASVLNCEPGLAAQPAECKEAGADVGVQSLPHKG